MSGWFWIALALISGLTIVGIVQAIAAVVITKTAGNSIKNFFGDEK